MIEARVLVSSTSEEDRFLPEGPRSVQVNGRDALAWVNIQTAVNSTRGTVHLRYWDTGELVALPQSARPGFVLPTDRPGVVIAGREKEIGVLDLQTNDWAPLANINDPNPRTIINDGEIIPGGKAIVFGTKDLLFADPIAHLYLFTFDDRQVHILKDRQVCSNGKVFARTESGLSLYDIDTPHRNVVRYRLDLVGKRLEKPEVVLDLGTMDGFPDGMVDAGSGSVIIAFYSPAPVGPGRAVRFDLKTGKMIEEWSTTGSPRVTCPLLVEREGKVELVLTTAVEGMPDEHRKQCPNAGALFIAGTAIRELPTTEVLHLDAC